MSFSGTVKEELGKYIDQARHCRIAEIAALLSACGSLDAEGNLLLSSENDLIVRKYFTLLKKTFNIETDVSIEEDLGDRKSRLYTVKLTDTSIIANVLGSSRMKSESLESGLLMMEDMLTIQRSCCRRAFIRGAFLAAGSISDPNKSYHFEIVCSDEQKANQLKEIMNSFDVDAKIVLRKHSYVVYVKESGQIVELLAVMRANIALMDLENVRILKEVRGSINRQVNCETANLHKTVNAAVKQKEDILLIQKYIGFDQLPPALADIARLRLLAPDATLKELGMMLVPQVGKSGVNHRLRKLSQMADELRTNEEEVL